MNNLKLFFILGHENSEDSSESSSEDSDSDSSSSSSESSSDSEDSLSDGNDEKRENEKDQSESEKSSYEIIDAGASNENLKGSKITVRSDISSNLDKRNEEDVDEESRATSRNSKDSGSSSESSDSDTDSTSEDTEDSDSSSNDDFSVISHPLKKETTVIRMEKDVKRRRKIRKRFTLPFFFNYIAWVLCIGVIFVSIFYLWAYGVMFGNDKTYQWLTSLLAYFWSDLLIVEPLKVSFKSIKFNIIEWLKWYFI